MTPTARATYEARKARNEHPAGTWDKAGRWYPDASEVRSCCSDIRQPSRAWPYSLMLHCRTATHCSQL